MSETRRLIADRVCADPGIHFSALVRDLDLAPGQVQYHVRRLSDAGDAVEERYYGQTHYYPPGYDEWDQRALALLRRETAADVVQALADAGPARPAAVADEVGVARSTLEWHLDRLVDAGLVQKRRDDRGRVTLALAQPDETARLLAAATPTPVGRLVDRFTRLVDALLEQ
ncbi:MAG: winged helix-turn-helix transcriptional regulator [Haloarculaceae archaeon]